MRIDPTATLSNLAPQGCCCIQPASGVQADDAEQLTQRLVLNRVQAHPSPDYRSTWTGLRENAQAWYNV
jgi:hypothetical protein